MTAHDKNLLAFGRETLQVLEQHLDWSADTFQEIAATAFRLGLATGDPFRLLGAAADTMPDGDITTIALGDAPDHDCESYSQGPVTDEAVDRGLVRQIHCATDDREAFESDTGLRLDGDVISRTHWDLFAEWLLTERRIAR